MLVKNLLGGGVGKAILILTSGSIIAQFLTILVSPLLTRFYTPAELGVYTLILTAESLFGSILCGRYDVSIVSESDPKKVFPLIKLSLIITLIFSTIATIGYGTYYFVANNEYQDFSYAVIFIFIMLIFNGLMRILEAYNNRYKEYKIMSTVYVIKTTTQNLGAVILGFFKLGTIGLLISHTFGMLFGLKKQSTRIRQHLKEIRKSSKSEVLLVMKEHSNMLFYSVPATFANRFSYTSIMLFIESLYGLTVLGFYSISYKVLGLPLTVLSTNISKVFFQEASREYDKTGRFIKSFFRISVILLILAVPMVLIMYYIAPIVFEVVFGPGWGNAGVYVQILAPMFGIRFIVNTVAYGLQIVKKQKQELGLQILFITASVGCFILSKIFMLKVNEFLFSITISFSLIYIIYYLIIMMYAYGNRGLDLHQK
ncbi:oligosaccharide flippase family protein [Neobacillus sp. CF12]|uniref:lipopolysaccharide biosynthesis protein n=1 Tax=Neobacillus sp. CF12 TaxID=3055864 RepID=UPI0025A25FA4|nr:oligosaccharide flippase family protein [Neobacillus sp. CF12]MDM5329842.1 oligosaccharide flippase family protein [Neobacillus sp. CF12]